ncbi:SGNH/GDSL hydrolase family protein [Sphingobacterium hungaricum]|uniref:Hydrolase n=1 Tax=Sphingobacterium hungaricum TaxID=2082723 RepID=A0A928UTP4_9SPHI|nr:SGNH/GDSL hydrolase family protein [Sphingobacterium hungaricum]MBE8713035.1 hydrolase [Sphingobacterium hungaricum]
MDLKKSVSIFILILCLAYSAFAQKKSIYYPIDEKFMIGKIEKTPELFHRIDTSAYAGLPKRVSYLATHAAGLAVGFKSSSTKIRLKWCVKGNGANGNLTPIAQKGFDLYIKHNGKWQFAGAAAPKDTCSDVEIISNMDGSEKEFLLYLPLYDELKNLEVAVDENTTISAIAQPFKRRILVYGSSIVQGASASRPGLNYTSILTRNTGYQFLNLGFSGSAKMEPEVANMVASIPADVYLLDCIPNSSPEEITARTNYLVKTIRQKHPSAPIILMQSLVREHGYFNAKVGTHVSDQNRAAQAEYQRLLQEGITDLYFLPSTNFLGHDHEGTVDGTHPNDIGFERMVKDIQPKILDILGKYKL